MITRRLFLQGLAVSGALLPNFSKLAEASKRITSSKSGDGWKVNVGEGLSRPNNSISIAPEFLRDLQNAYWFPRLPRSDESIRSKMRQLYYKRYGHEEETSGLFVSYKLDIIDLIDQKNLYGLSLDYNYLRKVIRREVEIV